MSTPSKTDWKMVDAKSDHELTQNAVSDPDNPPVNDDFFARAEQVQPPPGPKQQVTLRIDSDILAWFKEMGKGYQTMINAVLRAYKESQNHHP